MILNRQHRVDVSTMALERFFSSVRKTLGVRDESISVCLVSDAEMAKMNERYRGKRGPTDVLSFPSNGTERKERKGRKERRERSKNGHRSAIRGSSAFSSSFISFPSSLGDIAISPETARRNARRLGRPLDEELRILILHGVLHLLGYDHEADQGEMERIELRLRRELQVAGE